MHSLTRYLRALPWLGQALGLLSAILLPLGQAAADVAPFKNVVLILSDDHRYDFLGFHPDGPEFIETPNFDRMAREGAHMENAFVTTSLCSPSRATILTGQYMHRHKVVDNQRAVPKGTRFFPEYLQSSGIETAYIGKWHMGHDNDAPRKGFDHWASFKGQGVYFDPEFNINGSRKKFEGYNADVTADLALNYLKGVGKKRFYLQVGFKAVHYPFQPAKRHHGRYDKFKVPFPQTMSLTERNYETQPNWVRERRYGIHGIDHMETGPLDNDPVPSFPGLYRRFAETVHGLDENVGRMIAALEETGQLENTLVIFMSDHGEMLGDHGIYLKGPHFYEAAVHVPLIMQWPDQFQANQRADGLMELTDIAPTLLDAAGIETPTCLLYTSPSPRDS